MPQHRHGRYAIGICEVDKPAIWELNDAQAFQVPSPLDDLRGLGLGDNCVLICKRYLLCTYALPL